MSVCLGAARAETSWRDIETRIQYGYYTEDAPALIASVFGRLLIQV